MKSIGSFGPRSRPEASAEFEFCGERFQMKPVSGFVLLDVQKKSQELVALNIDKMTEEQIADQPELLAKLVDAPLLFISVLRASIGEAEYARLINLANEYAVELDVVVDLGKAAYEWASGFPTSSQAASSDLRSADGQSVKSTYSLYSTGQDSPDTLALPSPESTGRHAQTDAG